MARKKRHSADEIAAKLAQARELAAQGMPQGEIARTLGVSIMTLHRWRNSPAARIQATNVVPEPANRTAAGHDRANRIGELQIENSRLRRLVTDLLLEKIKFEEAAQHRKSSTRRAFR
jgi:IS30 family transposase